MHNKITLSKVTKEGNQEVYMNIHEAIEHDNHINDTQHIYKEPQILRFVGGMKNQLELLRPLK